jgi:DNA primase
MGRKDQQMIDRQTVERIKDAANIVDVVSDYVSLKKSGANYKGLCPFHNEKTPSFIVSPARGTCHCFGCGKGGNAISFLMEMEQITYPEALRRLAAKYHIEIKERELTDREKEEQSQRESMFIVNEWATKYFEDVLHNDANGLAIGMQYFRSRGFRDDIIRKFRLGYDLADRHSLGRAALKDGYSADFVEKVGLCYKNDRGELIDRFSGRVIFPWMNNTGKVVAFSGRVLDKRTKGVEQKYVNSPDSDIYHKDHELYGFFQAKQAINREGFAYIVEGQADVISMYQSGIENVVAGSGTALSVHQIHLLHRFVNNITLIYDDDAAGHHAAMEGIDKVLAEGMNVRIVVLPNGEDPDSFSRNHTADDFRTYVDEHQSDFIEYKTQVLLANESDPQRRAEGINSIVRSISFVQNPILRDTYIKDCAHRLGLNEGTLINQLNSFVRSRINAPSYAAPTQTQPQQPQLMGTSAPAPELQSSQVERLLVQLIVRHGERVLFNKVEDDDGNEHQLTLAQFINYSLSVDGLQFHNDLYNRILAEADKMSTQEGFEAESFFLKHDDIDVSNLAAELTADPYRELLQKDSEPINEADKQQKFNEETDRLRTQTQHLLLELKRNYLAAKLKKLQREIHEAVGDNEHLKQLMTEFVKVKSLHDALASKTGNIIIV